MRLTAGVLDVSFTVEAHTVPWQTIGLMCSSNAWSTPVRLESLAASYPCWVGALRVPAVVGAIEYKYVVLGEDLTLQRWEDGPNRVLELPIIDTSSDLSARLDVHDGVLFVPRMPRRVAVREALRPGAVHVWLSPGALHVYGASAAEQSKDFRLSVMPTPYAASSASVLPDCVVNYIARAGGATPDACTAHRAWTNRGALHEGCAFSVTLPHPPHLQDRGASLTLAVEHGNGHQLGVGNCLLFVWAVVLVALSYQWAAPQRRCSTGVG